MLLCSYCTATAYTLYSCTYLSLLEDTIIIVLDEVSDWIVSC